MWFLSQLLPHSPLYNVTNVFELIGPLNVPVIRKTLNEIVRRHEAFRTIFKVIDQQPAQVILPMSEVSFPIHDLTDLPPAEKDMKTNELVNQESRRLFSLETGPLFRSSLIRLDERKHLLLLSLHHIVCDGWSLRNLFQELSELYNAFYQNQPSLLQELGFHYSNFAEWQNYSLQEESIQTQMNYWKRQLEGFPSILRLPYDKARPLIQKYQGRRQSFRLPASLYKALLSFSRQNAVTLYMTLLASFNLLLYRYSGQEDILVGSTIANRTRVELEGLIGVFVNTLTLRTDLQGDPSFLQLLNRVRETALDAYSNQDVPFEKLIEVLQPERLLGQTPLFQVMFDFQKDPDTSLNLRELTARRIETDNGTAKFDLTLSIVEGRESLSGNIEYNTAILNEGTVSRMIGHFESLLLGVVTNPNRCISTFPLLTPEERHKLVVEWNDTKREYPGQSCIHQLFEAQVKQRPEAHALVFGDASLTYQDLNSRANQLAHRIESFGIEKNGVIAVCLERSAELIVTLLAILKAGAAYLPLDPTYPEERLAFMLSDSQAPLLITSRSLTGKIPASSSATILLLEEQDFQSLAGVENLPVRTTGEDLAYVMYTSGSTGKPKGVCIPHRAVNRLVCNTNYVTFSDSDRVAQISHSSFDAMTFEVWGALLHGSCLIGISKDLAISPFHLVEEIRKKGITVMFLTTALFNLVIRELPDGFQSVDQLVVGGEALDPRWIREAMKHGPPRKLINGYGPTESTTFAACFEIQEVSEEASNIPIGRPISNTRIYILDSHGEPVPIGISGELYIGGDGLAKGYWNRPELTEEKFVPDPFSTVPEARLYRTGDIARFLPDGNIEFLGRTDHQIKIRGFRVEIEEIEGTLSQHPALEKTVVAYTAGPGGEKRLVSWVIARPGRAVSATDLRDFLKAKLPEYMIPSHFFFEEYLPHTPGGKIDRKALSSPAWEKDSLESTQVSSRNPLEESIANVFMEVLSLKTIGIDENFFDLGGHSLLATQVISRIRKMIEVDLPLLTLFEAPTVRGMAEKVRNAIAPGEGLTPVVITPVARQRDHALSFSQQRLWFLDQLSPGNPFYNVCYPMRLKGVLDVAVLQHSLREIVRRHEVLRTAFPAFEGKPIQVVSPEFDFKLPLTDLSHLPEEEREAVVTKMANEDAMHPFNLSTGPLFRASLFRLNETDHALLLNWHHIIFDGWSLGVFGRELTILYSAFLRGRTSPLPKLPVQFVDFADWQRRTLLDGPMEEQLSYWIHQLQGIPSSLELPLDRPRPPVESFRGSTFHFQYPKNLQDALKEMSKNEGCTLFMTLLTSFMTLLHRYTGQEDIVIGSPIANRSQSEIENLIGFFVNTLVLRGQFSGNATFQEKLNDMKNVCLQAFVHQDLPFEKLVEVMQPERSLSRTPIFQVMFILQNAPAHPIRLPGIALSEIKVERDTAGFDLKLSMSESEEGLRGRLEYNTDIFDAQTIERFVSHFLNLLEAIAVDADQSISKFPLLSEAEKKQLQVEWNNTRRPYQLDRCIHQVFEEQASLTPDSVAVSWNGKSMTFAELNRRSNLLAHSLKDLGVEAETIVGICVERSIDMFVGLLGILKAGGAFLPLDPAYPRERLDFMLTDAGVPILLTQKRFAEKISESEKRVHLFLDSDWQKISGNSSDNICSNVNSENLAYVLYTSGSTGTPKGVLGTHRASLNRFEWMWETYPFQPGEICCQKTSLGFVDSIWEIFGPLLRGIPTVIVPDHAIQDTRLFTEILARNAVTRVVLVPSLLASLFHTGFSKSELPTLKVCICSGEALSPELSRKFFENFPKAMLLNLYGSTEVAADVTCYEVRPDFTGRIRTPIGRPIANTQIYILDTDQNSVPIGVFGELCVAGAGIARGYLNRDSLTQEKFIANALSSDASRLYKTGDLARYLADGSIDLLGRTDSQIKVRGYRIEPAEVEMILNKHPFVRECAVTAYQDSNGDNSLAAYIVPKRAEFPAAAELKLFLKNHLPEYMIPTLFLKLEKLPLTASGKVNRKALPYPKPEMDPVEPFKTMTVLERQLMEVWQELLPVKSIRTTDNFFDLGGHSLLAVQLLAAIEKISGRRIPLTILFQAPTIEQLAVVLQQQDWSNFSTSLIPIQPLGSKPPFFCVPGLGGSVAAFFRLAPLLGQDQPFYGLQPMGLDGLQAPHETIEQMTTHFVNEIRKIQPHGPYFLGGSSFGGFVAFDMAQRLTSLGEKVALLALFDTQARGRPHKAPRAGILARLQYHWGVVTSLPLSEKFEYLKIRMKWPFNNSKKQQRTMRSVKPMLPNAFRQVKEASHRAGLAYTFQKYPGRITLFRATLVKHFDPELYWGPYAAGGVEIHDIPAVHAILAREGSRWIVSRKLRDCLARAQKDV